MPVLHETFPNRAAADRAITDLVASGISADDISIVMSQPTKNDLDRDITSGAIGGGLAALAGGLVIGGALTVATAGAAVPFLVAGPLAGAFAGGVSGLAVGLVAGGIAGAAASSPDPHPIETHVNDGAVIVAVHATTENAPDVDEILRKDDRGAEPSRT
jgi:hypothetical protein